MTCRHAAGGCNYPEAECIGHCDPTHVVRPELTKDQARAVMRAVKLAYETTRTFDLPSGHLAAAYTELARAGATLE